MESAVTEMPKSRPRSHRKPLQPRKPPATTNSSGGHFLKKKLDTTKPLIQIAPLNDDTDKENRPFTSFAAAVAVAAGDGEVGPLYASLAEELGAARRRMERLRSEKEKTEKVLDQKHAVMDRAVGEMERRWEELRKAGLEINRLTIRFNDLTSSSTKKSFPFQSLREKEQEKNNRTRVTQEQASATSN